MYDVKVEPVRDEGGDDRNRLVITDDDGQREHWDYGEPEDNSFNRDWRWVASELRKAYFQGQKDGANGQD